MVVNLNNITSIDPREYSLYNDYMRLLIQRVSTASVTVENTIIGQINQGLLVLLGVAHDDTQAKAIELVDKLIELRIFDDAQGKMNLSVQDVKGEVLVVSQFTLYGNCDKGRRPSFDGAANPTLAQELYDFVITTLKARNIPVATGQFRATMQVALVNDGPVTFLLDK